MNNPVEPRNASGTATASLIRQAITTNGGFRIVKLRKFSA
jgi:hypothetical protein